MKTIKKSVDEYGYPIIEEYNANNQLTKTTSYYLDGKKIDCIYFYEYNKQGKLIRQIRRNDAIDGPIVSIFEYNQIDNKITKGIWYHNDQITSINEYDKNEELVKVINYQSNNKFIESIDEYNENGNLIKRTYFYSNIDTIESVEEYNKYNLIKKTFYKAINQTIYLICEYETIDGDDKLARKIYCNYDGNIDSTEVLHNTNNK